jgi:uncharacterized membrane protein
LKTRIAGRGWKTAVWAAVVVAIALYAALAASFASHTGYSRLYRSSRAAKIGYERAVVLAVAEETLERDEEHGGIVTGYQDLLVRVESGERNGSELRIRNVLNYTTNFPLRSGERFIAHVDSADANNFTVSVYSADRGPALGLLALLFAAVLCGVGGARGAKSLLGMAFTFASIALVMIPLLYRGFSPAAAAVITSIAAVTVSMLLLSGPCAKSAAAIAGSVSGIALSALLAFAFQGLARVSGFTTAEADSLLAIAGRTGMKVGELLFASFLISALGAVMDIAISTASAVAELHDKNPSLDRSSLFASGMNVGRDMMGTMANTLILAYAGTSLNALILIYSLEHSANQILDSNAAAVEIVQSLSSGLAVILCVPATAFFASTFLARGRPSALTMK